MAFPHFYSARAEAEPHRDVVVTSGGVPALATAPPPEFGGPGNRWSPETLTVAAIADCVSLTFKAIAKTRGFDYLRLECDVQGQLDRQDGVTSFTAFNVAVHLRLPRGSSADEGRRLVDLAKRHCLITNSLKGAARFNTVISIEAAAAPAGVLASVG